MKSEDLFQALGEIDEDLLTEKKPIKRHISVWMEIAASICICCLAVTAAVRFLPDDSSFKVWRDPNHLDPAQSIAMPPETQAPSGSNKNDKPIWEVEQFVDSRVRYLPLADPDDEWTLGVSMGPEYDVSIYFDNNLISIGQTDSDELLSASFKELAEGSWIALFDSGDELVFYAVGENILMFSAPEDGIFGYLDGMQMTRRIQTMYPFETLEESQISEMRFFNASEGENGVLYKISSIHYSDIVFRLNTLVVYQYSGTYSSNSSKASYLYMNVEGEDVYLYLPDTDMIIPHEQGKAYCLMNGLPFIMESSEAMDLRSSCEGCASPWDLEAGTAIQ